MANPVLIHFDDENNIREKFTKIASKYKKIDFKGSYGDHIEFLNELGKYDNLDNPIIVMLDVSFRQREDMTDRPKNGWELAKIIFESYPDTNTIMYTGDINKDEYFRKGIVANVCGYLHREDLFDLPELEQKLILATQLSSYSPYLSSGISKERYRKVFINHLQTTPIKQIFKPTQYKILIAIAKGWSKTKIINEKICLGKDAFNTHTSEIRTLLTNLALSKGILEQGERKIDLFQIPFIAYKIGIPEVLDAYSV